MSSVFVDRAGEWKLGEIGSTAMFLIVLL